LSRLDPSFLTGAKSPPKCSQNLFGQRSGWAGLTQIRKIGLRLDSSSNLHEFELHTPSRKGTKVLLQVIKAIINQNSGWLSSVVQLFANRRCDGRAPGFKGT